MRGTLDPLTQGKIDAFARRRRGLILVRGICAVISILLATMTLFAIIDRFFLMPDELRYSLSAVGYAIAIAGAWWTCARLVWRSLDPRELARLIEQVRPDLREDLISAVELGDPSAQEKWDSEEFREILQKSVATRMQGVEVGQLLSFRRISPWVWASSAVMAVVVALLLIPGLRYDRLLLRALVPMANVERVSRVKIAILEPNPAERSVPQGDVVPVRVETSGPETKRVFLETFPTGKKSERIEMTLVSGRVFESAIAVGREPVQYRIRGGDALTRKYTLTTVPRPEAITFKKTYVFPDYFHRPNQVSETRDNGDLEGWEGSTVNLEIEVNQDVSVAKLKVEQGGKTSEVELTPGADSRHLKGVVSLHQPGTYRVHLESRQWGFTNKFSPQYEIRAKVDRVPSIVLDEPSGDLIVPPDELVAVKGLAKDDVGLMKVTQAVKLNQADWKETPLAEGPALKESYPIARMWDLYNDLRVQPGDHLTMKLIAVDLKGNRAESSPVHLTISARGFDPQRLVPLVAKEAVYAELKLLRETVASFDKRVVEAAKLAGAEELQRKQAVLVAAGEAEKIVMQADAVENRMKDALRVARTGREASDLILVARLVKRLKEDSVQSSHAELDKGALAKARELSARAADQANGAEETYRDLLATEQAVAALADVKDLARDQQSIHRQLAGALSIKDAKAYDRLARRQGVAAAQVKTVEEILEQLAQRAPEGLAPRAAQLEKSLALARTKLKDVLDKAMDATLVGPSNGLQREIEAALNTLHGIEQDLARRAELARANLEKKSEPSFADVVETGRLVKDLAAMQAKADKSEAGRAKEKDQSDRTVAKGKAARIQLEARASAEEVRKDSDPFFVSDSSLAGRAMQAVLDQHVTLTNGAAQTSETLQIVEKAARTLETGHVLAELSTSLRELTEGERWNASTVNRTVRHPKDWQWMDARMNTLADEMKAAGFPAETGANLVKAWRGPAGDAVRREMAERHVLGRNPQPAAMNLEKLSGEVGRALTQIQPAMDEARKALQKLVPSLAERLENLSKASEKIQKETSTHADKVPQTESAQTKAEATKLLETQQGIDKQIEEVMAELRRDANTQDLFTEKGRERARDADDAVAMLKQSPPKAEELLNQAAATPQPKAQEHALNQAAEQQGKLKEALHTLAEHYKNLAQGKPEETRPELRKAEEALGIKQQLDQQYAQMERLAELAQQSPEALKAALENALKDNEAMQRELQRLTQNALDRAEAALNQAAQQENQAAQQQQAKTEQQKSLADQAKKIAEEARKMAREDVPKAQQEAQKANAPEAQKPLEQAKQDLEKGANDIPQDFSDANQAAKGLENAAQDLNKAAQDLRNAQMAENQQVAKAQQQQTQAQQQAAQAQQNAQKEARESQTAQQQAAQAQQQASQANQKAAEAQKQAAQQPQNQAAQQAAQQAQKAAQQAQQAAQQAQQNANKEAAEAQAAQQAAEKADAAQKQAQANAQQAQQAAQHAGQEAQQAAELANQARALASQFQQAAQANAQMAQAQQAQVAQELQGAQADLQQAQKNEQSLGDAQQAQALGQVAQGVQQANQNQVGQAMKAAQQGNAQQAQKADQAAQAAIEAQAQALAQARGQQPGQPENGSPSAEGSPLSEAAAEFMAQALNALNGQQQGQGQGKPEQGQGQGQPEQGQGQGEAAQAMAAAAQAQAAAMRQGRGQGQGQQPGQNPMSNQPGQGKGASVQAGPMAEGNLPPSALLKPGEWGKLPPRLAKDLMEGQRESVGGEYRYMIENYFKAIADKAREKK